MGLMNIQISAMTLLTLVTLFIALLVVLQWRAKNLKEDAINLRSKLNRELRLLDETIKKTHTLYQNETVLRNEILSLNDHIEELENELDHARKDSSDFENEMGNAQLEALELKDKNKIQAKRYAAIKEDNAELSKKLHSQKAHFGKQKKKIETLEAQVKDLDGSNCILEGVLSEALKVGYFVWQGKYHRATPVTAPKEKKLAREKLDAEFKKRQSKV